jgi:translation initiation factor 2 subunit 3
VIGVELAVHLVPGNGRDVLVRQTKSLQHDDIRAFIAGSCAENAPIIPISAQLKYNIDVAVDYMTRIPVPFRDFSSAPEMIIIRSFDVNKPGCEAEDLKGGVAGGTILKGVLKMGDEIEIRPGIVRKNPKTGKMTWTSIRSHITTLLAENNALMYAVPGGLIGVGLKVDPFLTRSDKLVGHVLGHPDKLPEVVNLIDVEYYLLRQLLGVKLEGSTKDEKKPARIIKLKEGETVMVNVGSTNTGARVWGVKSSVATI